MGARLAEAIEVQWQFSDFPNLHVTSSVPLPTSRDAESGDGAFYTLSSAEQSPNDSETTNKSSPPRDSLATEEEVGIEISVAVFVLVVVANYVCRTYILEAP